MTEYREVAQMLRQLIKNAQSPETPVLAGHIMALSEMLDEKADDVELEMIIEMQRKAVA